MSDSFNSFDLNFLLQLKQNIKSMVNFIKRVYTSLIYDENRAVFKSILVRVFVLLSFKSYISVLNFKNLKYKGLSSM
jgi:hypothetical protein